MISRGRLVVATVLIMVGLTMSGCVHPLPILPYVDVVTTREPAPLVAARCPLRGVGLGVTNPSAGRGPVAGTVSDFRPVRVLNCRLTDLTPTRTADGRLRYAVAVETAQVTDRFLDALDLPDQAFDPADRAACAATFTPPVYLLLLDRKGRAIRPQLPVDPCRLPRDEVTKAIADLGLTVQRTYTFTVAVG